MKSSYPMMEEYNTHTHTHVHIDILLLTIFSARINLTMPALLLKGANNMMNIQST